MPITKPPSNDDEPQKALIIDDSTYKPGHATELLSQSVQKLNFTDTKEDFRAQASKIINNMLVSRLNERKNIIKESKISNGIGTNGTILSNGNNGTNTPNGNVTNGKSLLATHNNGRNSISSNSSNASDRSASPPSPSTIPIKPIINKKLAIIEINSIPIPPPMPATLNAVTLSDEHVQNNTTITTDLNISDTNNHSHSNIVGSVHNAQSRFGGAPHKPAVTFAPNHVHDSRNGVAFRNQSSQLPAQSRDRRSYAGQSYGQPTLVKSNTNVTTAKALAEQQANTIAAELRDGKLPLCCICNVRIDR